jgi:hypothetical protein
LVDLAIDHDMVVAGNTLPRAGGASVAGLKILHIQGVSRKILIPFDNFAPIALSQNGSIPNCSGHN